MPPRFNLDTPLLAEQYHSLSDRQFQHGRLLLRDLDIQPGERVLDIGSGTGRLAEYTAAELVGTEGEVHGVEPLVLRVNIALGCASANHFPQLGRAEDLSAFDPGYFDAVYLNSVYHWLPEKGRALAEARRVLKAGGRIGINVASRDQPHDIQRVVDEVLAEEGLRRDPGVTAPYQASFSELSAQLEHAGFQVERIILRSFADCFPDPSSVIDFCNASSFGNFLTSYIPEVQQQVFNRLSARLEAFRGAEGIVLCRHLLFAVARRPFNDI